MEKRFSIFQFFPIFPMLCFYLKYKLKKEITLFSFLKLFFYILGGPFYAFHLGLLRKRPVCQCSLTVTVT